MKIAVAIPVKGQSEFLHWALRSLRAQDTEFCIGVQDATPDDSVQTVIRQYPDLPFTYMRHSPDLGQTAAIQEGWDNLEGDILCWLNADDFLFPKVFQHIIEIFQSHPDVSVVYGDAIFTDLDGSFTGYFPAISDNPSDLRRVCCISQPACFVRRNAVEAIGGLKVDLHYTMDWDLWTRLLLAGKRFFYTSRPLAAVRMYEGTKTFSRSPLRAREILLHVQTHAGAYAALKTRLSLAANNLGASVSVGSRLLSLSIDSYARIKKWWKQQVMHEPVKTLYGFEPGTNVIGDSAQVVVPYYRTNTASTLKIIGSWNRPPSVLVNGLRLEGTYTALSNGQHILNYALPQMPRVEEGFAIDLALSPSGKTIISSVKVE